MTNEIDDTTQDESDLVDSWHNGDLAKRIHEDDPASDALVIRVLAARIAARAGNCDDPLMTMRDLSHALGSLREATRQIAGSHAEPEDQTDLRNALDHLSGAEAALEVIVGWY